MGWENSPILCFAVAWLSCAWDEGENEGIGAEFGSDAMLSCCLSLLLQWRPSGFQVGKTGFNPALEDGTPARNCQDPTESIKKNTTKEKKTHKCVAVRKKQLGHRLSYLPGSS